MIKKLQEEMPRLGFEQLTPPESTSALLCFGLKRKNSQSIFERLRERKVHVRVAPNYLRVSPSVFNDMMTSTSCSKPSPEAVSLGAERRTENGL